jgi:tetratricopeptide (TPR) repeat protein
MATPSSLKVRKGIEKLATRIRDLLNETHGSSAGPVGPRRTLEYYAHTAHVSEDDTDWFDYAMEARALTDIDEFGLARAVLADARTRFSDEAELAYELAIVNWYEGMLDEAIQCFESALQGGVDRIDVLQSLGQVRIELGDFKRGVDELSEVVDTYDDRDAAAYARSAMALGIGALGDIEKAHAELDEAELETPRNAWLHFNRGLLLESMGDVRAVNSYVKALIYANPPLNRPKRLAVQQKLAELEWER